MIWQMFSGHLMPEAIELLVCYCFTPRGAFPYAVPVTHFQVRTAGNVISA